MVTLIDLGSDRKLMGLIGGRYGTSSDAEQHSFAVVNRKQKELLSDLDSACKLVEPTGGRSSIKETAGLALVYHCHQETETNAQKCRQPWQACGTNRGRYSTEHTAWKFAPDAAAACFVAGHATAADAARLALIYIVT